ncbi:MAG: MraY family glycosyltransferase, partial [Bacillota bacterium]
MGHLGNAVAAALAAFFVVLATTPLVERRAVHRGLVDRPGGRHLHARAVPRLGGIALMAGWVAGSAVLWATGTPAETLVRVLGGTAVVWLVGLYDDIRGLSPRAKLAGQLAAAAVAVGSGLRIEFVSIPSFLGHAGPIAHLGQWAVPVTILWLVGVSNAVNLLDGLDGLAAGVVAIAAVPTIVAAEATGLSEAAALLSVLAAGCVAFLRYNFSPARIFMGDGGALALGFAFAAASALGTAKGPAVMALLVPVMSLGVPLADTAWAILRRSLTGKPVGRADNGHVHHRLLARWHVPSQVVLALYAASAELGALGLLLSPQKRITVVPALVLAAAAVLLAARVAWDRFGWDQQHLDLNKGEGVEDGGGRDARL